MRRLLILFVVLGLGLLGCAFRPAAAAAQCYTPAQYYPTYYSPPVVERVIYRDVFIAAPVLVPVYSTGYLPPAVPAPVAPAPAQAAAAAPAPAAAPADDRLDKVLDALGVMSRRLDALEQRGGAAPAPVMPPADALPPPPAPPPAAPQARAAQAPGRGALSARCAACHTEGRLFARAGRATTFVLFTRAGSPAPLSAVARRKAEAALRAGTMPLDPATLAPAPLPREEHAAILNHVHG